MSQSNSNASTKFLVQSLRQMDYPLSTPLSDYEVSPERFQPKNHIPVMRESKKEKDNLYELRDKLRDSIKRIKRDGPMTKMERAVTHH